MEELVIWYKKEYKRRTLAVLDDKEDSVLWVDPATRVSWPEVCTKAELLGLDCSDVVMFRVSFNDAITAMKGYVV